MTQFITSESPIPAHMAFPSFLLTMSELSDSAKIIYCVLLCRAQLSQKRDGFTDEHGRIFIYYPIPVLRITIQRDLSRQIAKLTEEIEELKSEKLRLLNELKCADDKDIPKVQSEIEKIESTLATMEKANSQNSSKLLKLLSQYKIYRERAKSFNPAEFMHARLNLRSAKEKSAQAKLKAAYDKNFNEATYYASIRDTDTANADHLAAQPTDKASVSQNNRKPHIK